MLTLTDAQKYKDLLAKQFSKIDAESKEDRWIKFIEQKDSKTILKENLPIIKGILEGISTLSIKDYRDALILVIKKNKCCQVIPVLYSMTEGDLMPELTSHYLKITSIILNEEDLLDAYTVRYRDSKYELRNFCTYAINTIDARLQTLESIKHVSSNPHCIEDIIREEEDL